MEAPDLDVTGKSLLALQRCLTIALFQTIVLITLSITSVWTAWLLAMRLVFIWHVTISGDAGVYFAVGRGLLNGLKPYLDLFEQKPPGIFFLSGLSLFLTGDNTLYALAASMSVVGIVASLVVYALRVTEGRLPVFRASMILIAFLFGSSLAIYASDRTGGLEPELFGAFFGVLYLVVIAWDLERLTRLRILLAAILFLVAIGMKEPFILSLIATAALVSRDGRFFLKALFIPLAIALIAGVMLMAALGYLGSYLDVYLPMIFSVRLPVARTYSILSMNSPYITAANPLWLRGLNYDGMLGDVARFAQFVFIRELLIILWVANPVLKTPNCRRAWQLFGLAVSYGCFYLMHSASLFVQLLEILHFIFPWNNSFFVTLLLQNVTLIILCITGLVVLFFKQRQLFYGVAATMCALYTVTLAANVAGEFGHHNVFAIPALVATGFVCLQAISRSPYAWMRTGGSSLLAIALILIVFFGNTKVNYATDFANLMRYNRSVDSLIATGQVLDTIMSQCEFDRWLPLGDEGPAPVGTTRHSPYDLHLPISLATTQPVNIVFRAKLLQDLKQTKVIAIGTHDTGQNALSGSLAGLDPEVRQSIEGHFSMKPPSCAQPFEEPKYLKILFRVP